MNRPASQSAAIIWQHKDQLDQPAIALDIHGKLDKATVLQALREAFRFPDYFGDNWDAAYDLLLDQVDKMTEPALWRFSIEGTSEVDEADLGDWLQLMTDVCAYAESRELRLQVLIYSDDEVPGPNHG